MKPQQLFHHIQLRFFLDDIKDSVLLSRLEGILSSECVGIFSQEVAKLLHHHPGKSLVVDLSHLTYLSGEAAQFLISRFRENWKGKLQIHFVNTPQNIFDKIQSYHGGDLFRFSPSPLESFQELSR